VMCVWCIVYVVCDVWSVLCGVLCVVWSVWCVLRTMSAHGGSVEQLQIGENYRKIE